MSRRRVRRLIAATLLMSGVLWLAACAGGGPTTSETAAAPHAEPHTRRALLRIARRFNDDYSANRVGAVYDRWDARSREVISRADYVRRHRECHTNPGPATIDGAARSGRWWVVRYSISGASLTDYWRYEHGRWAFDLFRSNPQAVSLYRLRGPQYLAAAGCTGNP